MTSSPQDLPGIDSPGNPALQSDTNESWVAQYRAGKTVFEHHARELKNFTGNIAPLPGVRQDAALDKRHQAFVQLAREEFGRQLWRPQQIAGTEPADISAEDLVSLQRIQHWLQSFIMRPHPNLGRAGAVCPFVRPAIEESLIYLSVAKPVDSTRFDAIYDEMMRYRDIFNRMAPFEGQLSELRAIMLLFPYAPDHILLDAQDSMRLKTDLMRGGISLGQFIPESGDSRFLKSKFFPVTSPLPMFVIRTFIESDWEFIKGEKPWRDIHRERFGPRPNGH